MTKSQIGFDGALAAIRELGVLLETDRAFPSMVALAAGGPVKGTWWAHPLANEIYMMGQRLMDERDVLLIRLVTGKMTYVHRRLWPPLYAIARARESWQLEDLPRTAKSMLQLIDRRGNLRMDEIGSSRTAKELGADARILETRLLVFGDDVHTDSGAHVKRIETWPHWAERVELDTSKLPSLEHARGELERIVTQLNQKSGAEATLPWHARIRRKRSF
ncbi:MAG TPA: hypothetical protein VMV13_13860 [Candidatus Binataceae bacterium]|nr:hypothetical protein [Candidatus Binataceae bacterium]